ncbi:AI-2E family transporter [Paenibacillus sp. KS-LC4]|uniref:AI-2E family transporter n=1 Tax=Paenibacillus sp. KS-LC4 TaxID=2979727 RepID=UPI0030D38DA7
MRLTRLNQILVSIVLVLLILYLFARNSAFFDPIMLALKIIFVPIVLSVFLYYLLRPLVGRLHRWKLPKPLCILLIYVLAAALITLLGIVVWPILQRQLTGLLEQLPKLADDFQRQLEQLQKNQVFFGVDLSKFDFAGFNLMEKAEPYLTKSIASATEYVKNAFSVLSNFIIVVSTAPLLLYYMLMDDRAAVLKLLERAPRRYKSGLKETLQEMDKALSGFIVGRVTLCLLLGGMVLIGFLLIGLPYPLVLALVIAFMNMIPYIGQILGLIPCVIVAFIHEPASVIWVVVIIMLAQQIEGNILSPYIYGRKLDVHPITTMLLILVSGALGGIVGIMVAIPVYLLLKIMIVRIYNRWEKTVT